jgi:histidinol-phosphate/aromatic aminotransferase/cobyric acid decarboxylase-like protein
MKFNFPKLLQNYGSSKQILNQKLANFLLTSPEYVCLLNGLSQIYPILKCLFADKKVLIPAPTFGEYDRIFNNKLKYFDDESTSFEDTPANFISEAEIIVFVNPNNPTGSFIDNNRIMSIARQMPDKLFLVDESFCEFTGQDSIQSLLLKEPLNNIWVLKSLSKSLGVPGIRIGYIFSRDKDAIMKLNELLPIWNNNSFAEFFLEIILKYRNQLTESCKRTIIDREAFFDELKQLPAVDFIFPSKANFMLIRLNLSKDELSDLRNFLLIDHKIYIKDCSSKFMDGKTYIRVAVRSPEENSRLINALKTYSKAFI